MSLSPEVTAGVSEDCRWHIVWNRRHCGCYFLILKRKRICFSIREFIKICLKKKKLKDKVFLLMFCFYYKTHLCLGFSMNIYPYSLLQSHLPNVTCLAFLLSSIPYAIQVQSLSTLLGKFLTAVQKEFISILIYDNSFQQIRFLVFGIIVLIRNSTFLVFFTSE